MLETLYKKMFVVNVNVYDVDVHVYIVICWMCDVKAEHYEHACILLIEND